MVKANETKPIRYRYYKRDAQGEPEKDRANCKIRSFIIIMVSQTPFPLG
jgi:hypothetical protein